MIGIKLFRVSSQVQCARTSMMMSTTSVLCDQSEQRAEKLWENPWKHALPEKQKSFAKIQEIPVDWSIVERLMPIEVVPDVPHHDSFPTPSGWQPPAEVSPVLPYYLRRRRDHLLPLYLERKRDLLNETTLDFEYVELVCVRGIDGDVFACERDLRSYLEAQLSRPVATHVDEIKGRIKVKGAPRSLIEKLLMLELQKLMPSSVCCTNCRTKYSLLNREAGCSNCALSFCKKCLAYRAVIPNLSPVPVTVCYDCYKKIEASKTKTDAVVTTASINSNNSGSVKAMNSQNTSGMQANWWGEGLPPPSMRSIYANPSMPSRKAHVPQETSVDTPQSDHLIETKILEDRHTALKDSPSSLPIEEIERRLAALRGCDVELIRNPRSWLESNSNDKRPDDTVDGLMEMAKDLAAIEEKQEAQGRKEVEDFEERHKRLRDKDQVREEHSNEIDNTRMSVTSDTSAMSATTKDQMDQIDSLMNDAEKRLAEAKTDEKKDAEEMKTVLAATRQKSLDAMAWNNKVSGEIGRFWDRQLDKQVANDDSDDESLDEETLKRIVHEAQMVCDEDEKKDGTSSDSKRSPIADEKTSSANASPKKKGFFDKFFRRDSRS